MLRILPVLLASLLAVYITGCSEEEDYENPEDVPVHFVSVSPRSGETIATNATLTLTFDRVPINLTSSAGKVTVNGRTAYIDGPFTPGPLTIIVAWTYQTVRLTYIIVGE